MVSFHCTRTRAGVVLMLSQVCVLEGNFPQSKGVAILSFASLREAELWKDSVPEIKQQDWMDGVDMVIVPVCHIPRSPFLCIRVIRLFRAVDFLHIDRGLHMGKSV